MLNYKSLNEIDSDEFRELLLYGNPFISNGNLPHRTKLAELIHAEYHVVYQKMIEGLKVSLATRQGAK